MTNYKCKYCGYRTVIKSIMVTHVRNMHNIFDNKTPLDTSFEITPMFDDIDTNIPEPHIINDSFSGGGGDFGGGGASSDF